jgi:hypothetical protein
MAITVSDVSGAEIAATMLKFYVKGQALMQTIQDKPLLAWLRGGQKSFSGGASYVSSPVKGQKFSDTAGFLQGYTGDSALSFAVGGGTLRAEYEWKEVFAGWWINWTDLKKDGVTVVDSGKTSKHSRAEVHQLVSILQDRLDDFTESWAVATNDMLWKDGTQDSLQLAGLQSILTLGVNATGSIGGLSRATYPWWRHREAVDIATSPANQTLTKKLRSELRQLRRYGGRPNKAFAGSTFIEALEGEIFEKGQYTIEGFVKGDKTDMGMADVKMRGLGTFDYDPTLDDMGLSKACFIMDSRRITLRPMDGEDNKILKPERPYEYLVFLQGMTWTGALEATQLNCHGFYSIA